MYLDFLEMAHSDGISNVWSSRVASAGQVPSTLLAQGSNLSRVSNPPVGLAPKSKKGGIKARQWSSRHAQPCTSGAASGVVRLGDDACNSARPVQSKTRQAEDRGEVRAAPAQAPSQPMQPAPTPRGLLSHFCIFHASLPSTSPALRLSGLRPDDVRVASVGGM